MTKVLYPALKWRANGEVVEVSGPQDEESGLLDRHPADPNRDAVPEGMLAFSKERLIELLVEGGIKHHQKANVDTLRGLLADGLKAALLAREISYPSDASAESLYALLAG